MRRNADELADGPLTRAALESHDESQAKGLAQLLKRFDARPVPATLETGDSRVAGLHPFGELLLRQSEPCAVLDHDSCQSLELSEAVLLCPVSRVGSPPAPSGV